MALWDDLISAYRSESTVPDGLKVATVAQWILESGRGTSVLASEHLNFSGLKFRQRMTGFAEPVDFTGSDNEPETYCEFSSIEGFIKGYWHFISSGPYQGFENFRDDPEGYIRHLKDKGFAADREYVRKVTRLFNEARQLLGITTDEEARSRDSEESEARRNESIKVCVDPGHGMSNARLNVFDPGTTHQETGVLFRESDIALRYGLTLKDVFRARGVSVFMTRDDNEDHAPVGQRARNAEQAGCEVFISLHLNAAGDGNDQANGIEVLFRDDPDKPLARRLRDAVALASGIRPREIKKRTNLAVLRFNGPAALIELGFLANDGDREKLLNPQIRAAICEAIAEVVEENFSIA
jgi:N-acetylmuramoyl-L-alanine amidase